MAELFTHEAKFQLEINRCWGCGRYWAVETFAAGGDCPCCANAKYERLWNEFEKLQRTVNSLRGAVTKAKGRRR